MILYHKSNLVYASFFPQFLIFLKNNSAQTSVFIFLMYGNYYFFEKLKIVEENLRKLNCSCMVMVFYAIEIQFVELTSLQKSGGEFKLSHVIGHDVPQEL